MKKIALCFAALALAATPAFACPHEDKAKEAAKTAEKAKAKDAPKADKAKAKEAPKPAAEKTAQK